MATFWVVGQQILAVDINRMFGDNNWTLTYDADGKVTTAVDTLTSTTYTFTYNSDDLVSSYTDGTNTWTMTYNNDGLVTAIAVT